MAPDKQHNILWLPYHLDLQGGSEQQLGVEPMTTAALNAIYDTRQPSRVVASSSLGEPHAMYAHAGLTVPIFNEGPIRSVVAPDRSLDLFANRFELTRHVVSLINEDPPAERILYLHGLGGNGKSLLLRHLETRCCLRTNQWETVRNASDAELLEQLTEQGQQVPMARIDFGARPAGENRPQEAFSGLFMLKRQLSHYGIATPRFDFAAITYLHKLGFDIAHRVPELFPRGEISIAMDLADAVLTLPVLRVGQQLFQLVNSRMDKLFTRRRMQRRVPQEDAEQILTLVPEPDLLHALPRLFAKDLNDAAGEHARIVLLFDTHEAFFGEAIGDADSLIHADKLMRDEWLRCLLGHLDLGTGIVAIVAGRTRPPWSAAPVLPIPERYIDLRLVGHLTNADASQYLTLAGIDDRSMRAALVEYASTAPDEVHPYFLGLCADVALAAGPRLTPGDFTTLVDKERDLAHRLLQWTPAEAEYGILAVSACRAFTAETFRHLGQALDFPCDRSAFSRLTAFSFIAPLRGGTASGSGAYTMHNILRRSLQNVRPSEVRRAHELLAQHYGGRKEFTAELDAAYHLNHLNPAQGVAAWVALMDRGLATGRFDQCRALAGLLGELRIDRDEDRGRCLYRVARAYLGLGRWSQAENLLNGLPQQSAHAELVRAEVAFCRGDFDRAERLARAALDLAEGDAREGFLFRLAEIELYQGRFADGRQHATEGMTNATDQAPWLKLLGEIEYFSGNIDRAHALINQALQDVAIRSIQVQDQALYAGLLQDAALVAEANGAWEIALTSQNKALAIRKASEDVRGIAQSLHGLGKAQCGLGLLKEAVHTLSEAGRIARDLGDGLLAAKVIHSEADARQANGDHAGAWRLTHKALTEFEHHGTPYDVASACLSIARLAGGRERVRFADRGRHAIAQGGFGVLNRLFPEQAVPSADRIHNGLIGFCCGDALGVPWEGKPPQDIALTDTLSAREQWPTGSTSDDTEQLILLAEDLINNGGTEQTFLTALARALPTMRGAGPTTRRAVARFEATGSLAADGGATNGAMMRVLPLGWALPATATERRRELVVRMTKTTHADVKAIATACAVAAMGSWALETCAPEELIATANEELDHFGVRRTEGWALSTTGVSLDVMDTLGAVLHVLSRHQNPVDAMRYAVSLGGDTDTVAAIVGGILSCRQDTVNIPWAPQVVLPASLYTIARELRAMRQATYA
ncbi:ADP-ribosylglycohydrolase family protein [Nonomuraea sp. NPDC049655]|uniref:ADP-ribosylglycohydrolase family protein n=1 Tax=Nonomuraea sp. NPDC049655 TaxID=3364355 RepID=UPI0037BCD8E1